VTGCTGTDAATGVIQKNVEMLGHVEKRHGLAMVPVGQSAVLKLNFAALGEKCYADQIVTHLISITFFQ
jgi:hypothetical protein